MKLKSPIRFLLFKILKRYTIHIFVINTLIIVLLNISIIFINLPLFLLLTFFILQILVVGLAFAEPNIEEHLFTKIKVEISDTIFTVKNFYKGVLILERGDKKYQLALVCENKNVILSNIVYEKYRNAEEDQIKVIFHRDVWRTT